MAERSRFVLIFSGIERPTERRMSDMPSSTMGVSYQSITHFPDHSR